MLAFMGNSNKGDESKLDWQWDRHTRAQLSPCQIGKTYSIILSRKEDLQYKLISSNLELILKNLHSDNYCAGAKKLDG
jgi:hypothetical protein